MRRALLAILRALKWALLSFALIYIAMVLINRRDEELSAEELALAQYREPAVVEGQNAYLAMLGFGAPIGVNPIEYGAKRIAESNAAAAGDPWGRKRLAKITEGELRGIEGDELKWAGGSLEVPDVFDPSFLSKAKGRVSDVQNLLTTNAELVSRYLTLLKLPEFSDTAAPDILAPITPGRSFSQTRRLLLMRSALDVQSGNANGALEFLSVDSRLWRRVLSGNGTLLDEMTAVRSLRSDLHVISTLLTAGDLDLASHRAILMEITRPLSTAERNLTPMFAKEFAVNAVLMNGMLAEERRVDSESWLIHATDLLVSKPFFKINATLNRSARLFYAYSKLSGVSQREFLEAQAQVLKETSALGDVNIGWLYNPTGHILVGIAAPNYQAYASRVMDLAAYVDLVRAQLEWSIEATRGNGVIDSPAGANIASGNPYTGQPFTWDPTERSLSFEPASEIWRQWGTKVFVRATHTGPAAK